MYAVPFDKGEITFQLPAGWQGTVIESQRAPAVENVQSAVAEATARPINSPTLRELAKPGNTACIVFTDITRASPDHLLVPPILAELTAAGVRDESCSRPCR